MSSDPTDLIREVDERHVQAWDNCLNACCEIIANALDEERAYSAHLRDEVTRAKEWQGIGVATRFAEFREAQRWAEWFAAERDDAQQWSQHFEHEMREAQVSVVQFQQECTAQFPDLDDNCGPDEVASAIHMLRVERNNAFAAIRNMQENNFQCEAALAEANTTIAALREREETSGHTAESERCRAMEATRELVEAREVIERVRALADGLGRCGCDLLAPHREGCGVSVSIRIRRAIEGEQA